VAALRRYGIAASAPMFVPGRGAFVRLKQYPTDAHEEARTGLAGPLWGLWAALAGLALGKLGDWPTALSVASLAASINLFNLIPVWQLDGARGLNALSRGERALVGLAGLLTGALLGQWMPTLVGAIGLVRALPKDAPSHGDRAMLALFVSLIVAHAWIASFGALPIES
jgi:Zn-dependent protease